VTAPIRFTLPIKLHEKQLEVDNSTARFKVCKWGRRGGKTRYGAYWTVKNAISDAGLHWHVNKNLDLVRDEVWPHVLEMLPRECIVKVDETRLRIFLQTPGGPSRIFCKSADKEDALRGRGLKSLWVDEASFIRPTLWNNVLRATLADYRAPALITSSPRKGWFTSQWDKAKAGKMPGWEAFFATIYDNPYISREEIEEIRLATPEDVWMREYMAQEVDNSGVVYAEFDERSIFHPDEYPDISKYPCVVGADYGLEDPTGVVWAHVAPDGTVLWSHEHSRNGWDVSRHAEKILERSRGLNIDPLNWVLDVVNFRRDPSSGKSVAQKFAEYGINFQRSDKTNDEKFDTVKRFVRGNESAPFARVSMACPKLIDAFRTWEHGKHEPDILAAARYSLNHIVKRNLSPIAALLPRIDGYAYSTNRRAPVGPLAPGRVLLPRYARERGRPATRFSWDFEAGGMA